MTQHATISSETNPGGRLKTTYALRACALVVALLLLGAFLHETGTQAANIPLHQSCNQWDAKAADVVARLVHETTDASLRQAGDALFRLRRARRNCRAGWLALSCQDYHAIVRLRTPDIKESPTSKMICSLAMLD
jgi:hypothetical protein